MTDQPTLRDRALAAARQAIRDGQWWLPPAGQQQIVDAVLALVITPAEHCGAALPAFEDMPPTECILRPGHQGSHANEYDTRWIRKVERDHCLDNPGLTAAIGLPVRCPHCREAVPPTHWTKHVQRHHPNEQATPARHAADAITDDQLDQVYEELRQTRLTADRHFHNGLKGVGAAEMRALNAEERAKQAEAALATTLDKILDDIDYHRGAAIQSATKHSTIPELGQAHDGMAAGLHIAAAHVAADRPDLIARIRERNPRTDRPKETPDA